MDEEKKANGIDGKDLIDKAIDIPIPLGIACMLAYFIPVIGGIFFLFKEKKNKLLRFHSVQSILFWISFNVAYIVARIISWIPFLDELVVIVMVVSWIYIMYQAIQSRDCSLPVIGNVARKHIYQD